MICALPFLASAGARHSSRGHALVGCTAAARRSWHAAAASRPASGGGGARGSPLRAPLVLGALGSWLLLSRSDEAACEGDDKTAAAAAAAAAKALGAVQAMLQAAAAAATASAPPHDEGSPARAEPRAAAAVAQPSPPPAAGGGGGGGAALPELNWGELGVQLGLGGVAGFCSGYALKKAAKLAAFTIGAGFITIQLMRYNGMITELHWDHYEQRFTALLDADGDGRVTPADLQIHARRLLDVLGFNVPSSAAFGTAFLLGLRFG